MDFRISGLAAAPFETLFSLTDEELARRDMVRQVADRRPGYPCRVSLQDAEPGETVLLLNYEHLAVASPYRSRHAIYVREHAKEARLAFNEIPALLTSRLLSVRALDARGMMLNADVTPGTELAPVIEQMLSDPNASYLHIHNAKPGCYVARVDRVER